MDPWIAAAAEEIAERAPGELQRLVDISSPSGDVEGAEAALALVLELLPEGARAERAPCSSADHADDLIATLSGTGTARVVLLGHVDTVHAHADHRAYAREAPDKLLGAGTVDMKGGDVLAIGVLRALATRPEDFAEVALLLVCDEEWRAGDFAHVERFAGYDACLCFEGGELAGGDDAVVVRRKAAGTLRVLAHGRSAHSGSKPEEGANALLALATAAQSVAALHDPQGPAHLTSVPTVMRSGDAFNVVPAAGELLCDLRADELETFDVVLSKLSSNVDGVRLESEFLRRWPGMDSRAATAPLLDAAGALLGRPIRGAGRGGASDASYLAPVIDITVDGLGPLGGGAHTPDEYIVESSLRSRAEVALALAAAVLATP